MCVIIRLWFALAILFTTFPLLSEAKEIPPIESSPPVQLSIFMSATCSHCRLADEYIKLIEASTPWLKVKRYYINQDKTALELFHQYLIKEGSDDYSVPAFFFCNARWVGFDNAMDSGKLLLRALNYCYQQQGAKGQVTNAISNTINHWGQASLIQTNVQSTVSPFIMSLFCAFIDVFNPTSFFCIGAVFALFLLIKQQPYRLLIGLALLGFLVIHILQTINPSLVSVESHFIRLFAVMVGGGMLYGLLRQQTSWIFAVLGALFLIGLLNYQQPSIFNIPLVFYQWLLRQPFSRVEFGYYFTLYQIFFVVFWILIMVALHFLIQRIERRIKQYQINRMAKIFLVITAVILMGYPEALLSLFYSIMVLVMAIFFGVFFKIRE